MTPKKRKRKRKKSTYSATDRGSGSLIALGSTRAFRGKAEHRRLGMIGYCIGKFVSLGRSRIYNMDYTAVSIWALVVGSCQKVCNVTLVTKAKQESTIGTVEDKKKTSNSVRTVYYLCALRPAAY